MGTDFYFNHLKHWSTFISVALVLEAVRLFTTTRQLRLYWTSCSPSIHADWFASSSSHLHTWVFCSVALYFSLSSSSHLCAEVQCVAPVQVASEASLRDMQRDAGPRLLCAVHPVKCCSEGTAGRPMRAFPVKENQSGDTWAPAWGTTRTWWASFGCARRRIFGQIGRHKEDEYQGDYFNRKSW